MKSLETQIAEFIESQKADKAEILRLQGVLAKADKTVATAKLAELIKEAGLPEVSSARLAEAFKDATSADGMQEAVNVEKKYVDAIKESTGTQTVIRRKNGSVTAAEVGSLAEMKEAQVAAFKASGFDEATAKSMAGL